MNLQQVQTLPKSRFSEGEKARKVKHLALALNSREPVPVIYGAKVAALVGRDPRDDRPYALPAKYWMGIRGYDDLIKAITVDGSYFTSNYTFSHSSSPTAGAWCDTWLLGGDPSVGALGTAATATQISDQTLGAIQHGGDVSPKVKVPLWVSGGQYAATTSQCCNILVYDRVLAYDQCTCSNSLQNMTNGVAAARYASDGFGLQMFVAQQAAATTGSAITAISYTNATPTSGRAALGMNLSNISSTPITDIRAGELVTNTYPFVRLASTDTGVTSIESYTTNATDATSKLGFILGKPLFVFNTPVWESMDLVHSVSQMEPILDGACIAMLVTFPTSSFQGAFLGQLGFSWL